MILLDQARLQEPRKGTEQVFQSCTFNRSVTSPIRRPSSTRSGECFDASIVPLDFLQIGELVRIIFYRIPWRILFFFGVNSPYDLFTNKILL